VRATETVRRARDICGEMCARRARSAACRAAFEKREKTNRGRTREKKKKRRCRKTSKKQSRSRRFPQPPRRVPGRAVGIRHRSASFARATELRGVALEAVPGRAVGARRAPSGAYHVDVAGEQARVHPELAHATRDELRVLRAIVQDHDGIGSGDGPGLASGLLGGVGRHGVADVCVRRGDTRASLRATAARRRFSREARKLFVFKWAASWEKRRERVEVFALSPVWRRIFFERFACFAKINQSRLATPGTTARRVLPSAPPTWSPRRPRRLP